MPDITVRDATISDSQAIADIYRHYVLDTTATFDFTPDSAQDRATWIAERDPEYPIVVAEKDGEVVAWGALSRWGERPGWAHTVEISVYVDLVHRGHGVGTGIMEELLERARKVGHHAVIGQIVAGNEASLSLARAHGFEDIGVMKEVGRKFDQWLDLILVERIV